MNRFISREVAAEARVLKKGRKISARTWSGLVSLLYFVKFPVKCILCDTL